MKIIPAQEFGENIVEEIPNLVHATGPSSYDYQFLRRALFDAFVRLSWNAPGTLFAADAARVAVDDNKLIGLDIAFIGDGFRQGQSSSAPIWDDLLAQGVTNSEELAEITRRMRLASWLNPIVRKRVYYIHALSVQPSHRSKVSARFSFTMPWTWVARLVAEHWNWMSCQIIPRSTSIIEMDWKSLLKPRPQFHSKWYFDRAANGNSTLALHLSSEGGAQKDDGFSDGKKSLPGAR